MQLRPNIVILIIFKINKKDCLKDLKGAVFTLHIF
jgi:hypothetical protein